MARTSASTSAETSSRKSCPTRVNRPLRNFSEQRSACCRMADSLRKRPEARSRGSSFIGSLQSFDFLFKVSSGVGLYPENPFFSGNKAHAPGIKVFAIRAHIQPFRRNSHSSSPPSPLVRYLKRHLLSVTGTQHRTSLCEPLPRSANRIPASLALALYHPGSLLFRRAL